jgi:hypothetical protein
MSCPDLDMSSAESLADIWTLWMLLKRTLTPACFENRFARSESFTSELGA